MLIAVFLAAFIICLPNLKRSWELALYRGQFYDFRITNQNTSEIYGAMQGISLAQAEDILKRNIETGDTVPLAFYKVLEDQMLTNREFGRSSKGTVYKIKGESCLLFPDGFPLGQADTDGCLVSKGLAWELFGDTHVTGALISYDNREYVVRGILPSKDIIFAHSLTEKEALLDSLMVKAGSYRSKEQYKDMLSQYYGLQLNDRPSLFQRYYITTDRLPSRVSNFSEWLK